MRTLAILFCSTVAALGQRSDAWPNPNIGVTWTPVSGNPIMVGGSCNSWRCAGMGDPTVVETSNGGSVLVWATAVGITTGPTALGPYLGRATGTSPTATFSFSPEATVDAVGSGRWDNYIDTPTIRYSPGYATLTQWYLGYSAAGFVSPGIGQMVSTDATGTAWTHPGSPIYSPTHGAWDGVLVTGPTVVLGPDGIWRLYYTGIGTVDAIGLLTSTNGTTWTPYAGNPVFSAGATSAWDNQIIEQSVIYRDGKYWMWYSGYSGALTNSTRISIGLATSPDGIHWTRDPRNPVLIPGTSGSWNDLRVLAPDVIVEPDGSLLMVAYGLKTTDPGQSVGSIGIWRSSFR